MGFTSRLKVWTHTWTFTKSFLQSQDKKKEKLTHTHTHTNINLPTISNTQIHNFDIEFNLEIQKNYISEWNQSTQNSRE